MKKSKAITMAVLGVKAACEKKFYDFIAEIFFFKTKY